MTRGVAVVTGGASGFGRAIAERCAAAGFDMAILDVDGERATMEAAALARSVRCRAIGRRVDVAEADDVAAAAEAVAAELGGIDLVFSNVGVQQIGALENFPDEAFTWILDVNVVGAARVARSFLPMLRQSSDPHLAFTASSSVLVPATHLAAYQASKFAVLGLAETLRLELAPDEIAVSVIFPSGMVTRHLQSSLAARPVTLGGDIAPAADIAAMLASNEGFARDVTTPDDAARDVVEGVLAGRPYVVTHGDLVDPLVARQSLVRDAAVRARDRREG